MNDTYALQVAQALQQIAATLAKIEQHLQAISPQTK
jgi:hypothetical protein